MSAKRAVKRVVDPENPEWTKADFARAVPFSGLPSRLQRALSGRKHEPQKESLNGQPAVYSRLITQAARKALRPLGLLQKGRSRTWLGDHGWRLDVVEFQPSSWSRGSYLNVSSMWLWNVKPYISFDAEHLLVKRFHRFEDQQQFSGVANKLAAEAADTVMEYRRLFPTVIALSDCCLQNPPSLDNFWPAFNAAVAHGLSGRNDVAATILSKLEGRLDRSILWQKDADLDVRYLGSIIQDPIKFRLEISERIEKTRSLQRLPPMAVNLPSSQR